MSISSDGIFFYGLIWKDEEPPWGSPTPDELQKASGEPEWEDLFEARSGQKLADSPVVAAIHCSFSCPMPLVAIQETLVYGYRGYPKQAKSLTVKLEWEGQLRKFCDIMGIEWQEPAWWVASLYG